MGFLVLHLSWRLLSKKVVVLYSRVLTAFAPWYQSVCLFSLKVGGVISRSRANDGDSVVATSTDDGYGFDTLRPDFWVGVADVWARLDPLSSMAVVQ